MDELDLKGFVKSASEKDVDEFVRLFCGDHRNQLYQLTGGFRNMGPKKAKDAAKWFAKKGYNVPLHRLRPDIWSAA